MTDAAHPQRLATAEQFVMHIGHRDFDRSIDLLSPNVEYRVPGNHALSGVFSGREEVTSHLIDLVERTAGSFEALKWEDWMLGEHHVAALAYIHIQFAGQRFEGRVLFLVRFDIDDKIAEIVAYLEDERGLDRVLHT